MAEPELTVEFALPRSRRRRLSFFYDHRRSASWRTGPFFSRYSAARMFESAVASSPSSGDRNACAEADAQYLAGLIPRSAATASIRPLAMDSASGADRVWCDENEIRVAPETG